MYDDHFSREIQWYVCFQISCSSPCSVSQFTMDSPSGDAHTKTGGSMVMLTPTSQFTTDQVFMTPWMDDNGIADLVIIVNKYPIEGLYINDKILDVSTAPV